VKRLVLISCERSGTNWHQDLLRNNASVFALGELFNPIGAFGLVQYGQAGLTFFRDYFGDNTLQERSQRLTAALRSEPEIYLKLLENLADRQQKSVLSFLLFPDHLPDTAVRSLLDGDNTIAVFLVRNRLPRYVSLLKAMTLDIWRRHDTTDLRVTIDFDDFLAVSRAADDWFRKTSEWAFVSDCTSHRVSYENDLDKPPAEAYAALCRLLEPHLSPERPETIHSSFFKQDDNRDVFRTIVEGEEVRRELNRRELLDYALSSPEVFGHPAGQGASSSR